MIRQTILLACLSAGVAFSQGLTATSPLVGLPAATFGGAGIPNTAVAVQTVNNNGNTITLGLNASERFANPVVTNNNAGTFFASVGPDAPPNLARWNFNFFISATTGGGADATGQYTFDILYDMDPASFTPGASLGRMVLPNAGFPSVGGVVQNSQNLGFAYLRTAAPGIITPPAGFANPGGVPFDPTTPGHYTFALRAFDLLGNQVAQVVIHVSTLADPNAVTPPAGSYQVRYFSNLNAGDSFINITNTGERGAGLAAGTTANTTGAICVNAYVFSPDEQMVSCCSCPVTPNGLVSMSASSLVSNTLTPAVPTSIVVKLVSTIPTVANGCTNSAAAIQPLAPIPQPNGLTVGMLAWATTLHAPAVAGLPFATTETPFAPATLSTVAGAGDNIGELNRLARLCNFINANGSGFGICRACRLGGLGAGRL